MVAALLKLLPGQQEAVEVEPGLVCFCITRQIFRQLEGACPKMQ